MNEIINDIKNSQLTNDQIALWYLGQEGFIIKFKEKYIAIDLYLTDYVDKHCNTKTVVWKRNYASPVSPDQLDFIDYYFCTHSHYDHADPDTLCAVNSCNKKIKFIVPKPKKNTFMAYGIDKSKLILACADTKIDFGDFSVLPIPSAHEEFHQDENGNFYELGYIFKVCNDTCIFHAGDMCIYNGLMERIKNINLALLPINGRDYFRYSNDIIGNFDSQEALILAKECKIDTLVPMHFDLYDINSVHPSHFVDLQQKINPKQKYKIFSLGEKMIYQKPNQL